MTRTRKISHNLGSTRPWEQEGVSRATWYRWRGKCTKRRRPGRPTTINHLQAAIIYAHRRASDDKFEAAVQYVVWRLGISRTSVTVARKRCKALVDTLSRKNVQYCPQLGFAYRRPDSCLDHPGLRLRAMIGQAKELRV